MICIGGALHGQYYNMVHASTQHVHLALPTKFSALATMADIDGVEEIRQAHYVRMPYRHPVLPDMEVWQHADTSQEEIWPQFFNLFPHYR